MCILLFHSWVSSFTNGPKWPNLIINVLSFLQKSLKELSLQRQQQQQQQQQDLHPPVNQEQQLQNRQLQNRAALLQNQERQLQIHFWRPVPRVRASPPTGCTPVQGTSIDGVWWPATAVGSWSHQNCPDNLKGRNWRMFLNTDLLVYILKILAIN